MNRRFPFMRGRSAGSRGEASGGGAPAPLLLTSAMTFTRASVGTYQTSASTLAEAAIDEERYENRGDGLGDLLLVEQEHENLLPNSRDISAASWLGAGTVTADHAVGPNGEMTADRVQTSSGASGAFDGATAGRGSLSVWVKSASGSPEQHQAWVGNGSTASIGVINTVGEEWQLVTATLENPAAPLNAAITEGLARSSIAGEPPVNVASDLHLEWAQWCITARYPLSVIETGAGSASCDADIATWAEGSWDTRIASDTWTMAVRPLFSSDDDLADTAERVLLSFEVGSGTTHRLYLVQENQGAVFACRIIGESDDTGALSMQSESFQHARHDLLTITVSPSEGWIEVNGIRGPIGDAMNWPTTGAVRLGGTHGGTDGFDGRFDATNPIVLGRVNQPAAVAVLPIGDSITVGGASVDNNGYTQYMTAELTALTGVYAQNVGPNRAGSLFDSWHCGVNGNSITDVSARLSADTGGYVGAPNLLLTLHIGTGVMDESDVPGSLAELATLLDEIYALHPTAKLLVYGIPERTGYLTEVAAYNAGIPGVIAASDWPASQVAFTNPGITEAQTADGVHPNDAAHVIIGEDYGAPTAQTLMGL